MTEKEKLAYFVGIFDGEGHIAIEVHNGKRGNGQYYARLNVGNTDKRVIDWLVENYGGYSWSKPRKKPHLWKQCYTWIRTIGREHKSLIESMIPYSIIKRERLFLLRDFLETKSTPGKPISEEVRKTREEIVVNLNRLNKRGPGI